MTRGSRTGYRATCLLALASLALGGCGSDSNSGGGNAAGVTDFNGFVRTTLAADESAEPREVEDRDFDYTDDPDAFNDLVE